MKIIKRIPPVLFSLLFLFVVRSNAQTFDTSYAAILQSALNTLKSSNNLVGISAGVYVPGQGMWLGTSGISEPGIDITPDMVFGQGSTTKNLIAAVILQLQEEDSLSIDDSLHKWLPPLNNIDTNITIKQLLSHRSGIYNFTENNAFLSAVQSDWDRLWTPEEIFPYVLAPYFAPGTSFRYCNTNYILLGMIITKITGNTISEELNRRFFIPLGLDESFIETQDTVTSPYAHNWVDLNSNGILDDAFFIPRTALYSSTLAAGAGITKPENLVRWLRALFGGNVLNDSTLNKMLTFGPSNVAGSNGYGLGLMRYSSSGRTLWGHGGNVFGYATIMMYYPQDSIAMVLMTNRDIDASVMGKSFMNTIINNNPVGISNVTQEFPENFRLHQNYPNPFNPSTTISFELPKKGMVKLSVYNLLGQEVSNLVSSNLNAGIYQYEWNASNHPSGIYYYRFEAENFSETKKMILIK